MIERVAVHSRGGRARSRDFVKRWAKANSSRMSVGTFARRLTDDPMTSCGGRPHVGRHHRRGEIVGG